MEIQETQYNNHSSSGMYTCMYLCKIFKLEISTKVGTIVDQKSIETSWSSA